jgi:excisionase family DNA binding protein
VLLIDNLIMAVERHDPGSIPSLLTIEEVAECLRVSKTSVYRLVERRELPFCRVGRTLRFTRKDLETYLAARRVASAAADDNI